MFFYLYFYFLNLFIVFIGIFYETCAICLDDYVEGEKIRILPCNHGMFQFDFVYSVFDLCCSLGYHMKCIDPWLTKNRRVCPVCKAKVTLPGMVESEDSDSDNDRRPRTSNNDASERSPLLPSNHRSNRSRTRNLGRLLIDSRVMASTYSNSSAQLDYNQPIDDTFSQPGPSTSAPVVSELSSHRVGGGNGGRNKRKKTSSSNIHVVVAEIAPLIAPPQLSINCDTEQEGQNQLQVSLENNVINSTDLTKATSATVRLSTTSNRQLKRTSVDHIV